MARASICWCLKVHHGQSRCEYFWTCCVETCCFLIEMPFCAEHVHDSEGIFCVEDGFGFGSFFWLNGHQQNMVIPTNLNVKKAIDKEWPFDAECLCDFFWHACFGRTRPCREIYLLAAYQQFFTCICVHIIYFCICLTSPI